LVRNLVDHGSDGTLTNAMGDQLHLWPKFHLFFIELVQYFTDKQRSLYSTEGLRLHTVP